MWLAVSVGAATAVLLGFVILPVVAIFLQVSPGTLLAQLRSPVALQALAISLKTSTIALGVILVVGTPVAYMLSRSRTTLAAVVTTLIELPLVLPPAVAGIGLLAAFGRFGLLGPALASMGIELAFTQTAVVMALIFVAMPFHVRFAFAAFRALDPQLLAASRTLGAGAGRTFFRVAVPVASPGLAAGAALAWARALGEFGATLLFAGSFAGRTQTLPLAIYANLADFQVALAMSALLVAVSGGLLVGVKLLLRGRDGVPDSGSRVRETSPVTLELEDVRKVLPAFEVAATFAVAEETLALVGPSGAGKSSLLRMVAGLQDPDSGRIRVGGRTVFEAAASPARRRPPLRLPPEARRVGLVFQDYALFPNLSVRANVAYGPRSRGRHRAEARALADTWLERLGMVTLADERPRTLSGGERQRVALARALASEPDALLLDEPLSALDAVTKASVSAELASELREVSLPTVLVSHDFADVVGLADRIAVIEEGRIVQVGTATELLEAPASAFVAGFTGVNYFAGTASRRGELTEVRAFDGPASFVSTDAAEGPVGVVVLPWDVSVSVSITPGPTRGSALNALTGPVRRVAVVGNRARVTVDSHPTIVAEVTEGSARRLSLAPGVPVVATWKATGTRLVPRGERGPVHRAG